MKILVGSQNQVKVNAITESVQLYPKMFSDVEVIGVEVNAPEFGHPVGLPAIISGAQQRAKAAFAECNFSIGIESGLIQVPETLSGYMEISSCVIYDGKDSYTGLSCAFEWPPKVTTAILSDKTDASSAFHNLGYTDKRKLGAEAGGIVGFLTAGRMRREDQIRQSFIMAMIYLENKNLQT